jgi:beta-glucanase (GH16 family)
MREAGWWGGRLVVLLVCLGLAGCTAGAGQVASSTPTRAAASPAEGQRLVFDDSFDGTALDRTRWSTCHWWDPDRCTIASNQELQWYLPGQVRVQDGHLLLIADHSTEPDRAAHPFVSGMVTTGPQEQHGRPKFAFTYGRVEVELSLPTGTGLWPAVWMLPASTSSRPEIDLLETVGSAPHEWLFHLHPADRRRASHNATLDRTDLAQGRHTLALEWTPDRLRWFVDGKRVWEVRGADVPREPMYLVANLAVGGEYPGAPDASTRFPATVTIDRVRVWQ